MTISSLTSRVQYAGAGSTGPYAFPFRIFSTDDLRVTKRSAAGVETRLAYAIDFTLSNGTSVGDASGSINLITALAVGETLAIRRVPALLQPTSIQNQGNYFPKTHEDEFDRLVMQVQELADLLGRSFGVPESFDPADLTLSMRPETGKVLGWLSTTQLGSVALDAGAIAIPGAGRTVATLTAYIANNAVFNVKDFGAAGDGVTDDTTAIRAAIAAAELVTGSLVWFPAGTYLTSGTLTITSPDMTFAGQGLASILKPSAATFNLITLLITAHRSTIRDLWVKGAAVNDTTVQYGIYTNALAAPDDVCITNCFFGAASATTSLNSAVKIDGGNRWKVVDNTISYLMGAISLTGYGILCGTTNRGVFSRNHFIGSAGHGRHAIYLSGGCTWCKVQGNLVEGMTEDGLPVYSQAAQASNTDNEISGNTIINGGNLTSGAGAISVTGKCSRNLVANNKIYGFAGWGVVLTNAGTGAVTDENVVANNDIRNTSWGGVALLGVTNTRVRNNVIRDVSQASAGTFGAISIQLDAATICTNTIVEKNDAQGAATLRAGLYIPDAGHTGTVMNHNYFPDGASGKFYNPGAAVVRGRGNDFGGRNVSGDNGDASQAILAADADVQRWATALTANRVVTLSVAHVFDGAKKRIVRTGLGAFNLDVGGLKTIVGAVAAFVDVEYDSTAGGWKLTGYGAL